MNKRNPPHKVNAKKGYNKWVTNKYQPQQEDVSGSQKISLSDDARTQSLGESPIQATNVFEETAIPTENKSAEVLVTATPDIEEKVLPASDTFQLAHIQEVLVNKESSVEQSEKRVEPQNLTEFIDAFLNGKVKSISEALARRLWSSTPRIDVEARGELLRLAQASDVALDKIRKLFISAKKLTSNSVLEQEMIEFCLDCVLSNEFVRAEGMRTLLFPGHEDNSSLEEAWARLQSLTILNGNNIGAEEFQPKSPHANDSTVSEVAKPSTNSAKNKNEKSERALTILAARTRRNALCCSAIWRVRQKQMEFPEVVRALRATLFVLEKRVESVDDELLEALSSISEKESDVVALVLDWSLRQQIESLNRFEDVNRRYAASAGELGEVKEQLIQMKVLADSLRAQLGEERAAGEELHKELGVAKTHGQADLEDLRSQALKTMRDAVSQLDVVSEALRRDPPKIISALDKVEAVMDRLKSTNQNLENT
jgi:hypothetical protein